MLVVLVPGQHFISPSVMVNALRDRQHRGAGTGSGLVRNRYSASRSTSNGTSRDNRPEDAGEVRRRSARLTAVGPNSSTTAIRLCEPVDVRGPRDNSTAQMTAVESRCSSRCRGRRCPSSWGWRVTRNALVMEPQPVRQRVVAADRDQGIDAEVFEDRDGVLRRVVRTIADGTGRRGTPGRSTSSPVPDSSATCAGPCPTVRSMVRTAAGVERHGVGADRGGVVAGFDSSSPAHPRRIPTTSCPLSMTRLTTALMHEVETRDVAAAGVDADEDGCLLSVRPHDRATPPRQLRHR